MVKVQERSSLCGLHPKSPEDFGSNNLQLMENSSLL